MKSLLFGCVLLAISASAAPLVSKHEPVLAPVKRVEVFFNRQTTFAQLVTIKQEVVKDGLTLEYDRLEFDKSGHLLKMSFHVDVEGYTWGSATEDDIPADYSFGFMRDFTPGAKVTFQIGNFK
jgi:opacity protein-like surface antigen